MIDMISALIILFIIIAMIRSSIGRAFIKGFRNESNNNNTKWKSIDTAPKDGSWVLLRGGEAGFSDYNNEVKNGPGFPPAQIGFYNPPNEEWCEEESWNTTYWDGTWGTEYIDPTHWMPIPEYLEQENAN